MYEDGAIYSGIYVRTWVVYYAIVWLENLHTASPITHMARGGNLK